MAVNVSTLASRSVLRPGRLAAVGGLAALTAAAANLTFFLVAKHAFTISFVMPYQGPGSAPAPLPAGMVIIASAVSALAAAGLLGVLTLLVARPRPIFLLLAALGALLSLGGPLSLAGVGLDTRLALITMHLLAAAIIVGLLSVVVPARPGSDQPGS